MSFQVTAIIPNYRHAPYLKQRIESVLNQSYPSNDIIILDDASPDSSLEIIHHYAAKDSRIRVIANEKNSGSPFIQWNRGVQAATHDHIWIAESDDWADEHFLATVVGRLEANPKAVLSYCQSHRVDGEGKLIGSCASITAGLEPNVWQADFSMEGGQFCRQFQAIRNAIPNASAVVFRKSTYLAQGGAPTTMKVCGDWLLWSRVAMQGDVEFSAAGLNYWRTHGATARAERLVEGFYEASSVMDEVAQLSSPSPETIDLARIHKVMAWQSLLRQMPGQLRTHRDIYRHLRKTDPRLLRHFVVAARKMILEKAESRVVAPVSTQA